MNELKDNGGLPKISTRDLTTAKISLTLGDKRANKMAAFLGENNNNSLVLSENVVQQRPLTAITVTRKGEIKHKVVSAPVKGFRKRIRGQDNTEMVVLFPSDQEETMQQGWLGELDSQNELSNNLSKLSVLQPLDGMRTSLVGKNGKLYKRNKNIQNSRKGFGGGNANSVMAKELPRFSKRQQTERLPLISERDLKKSPGRVKDRGTELENHLKKADEDYDQYVEKASILFNWITSQNTLT